MLALSVEAQLPLIAVTTRDVQNFPEVVHHVTGKKVIRWMPNAKLEPNKVYFYPPPLGKPVELPFTEIYDMFVETGSSLIVVNPKDVREPMFNAGEVPVPRSMLLERLMHVVSDKKKAEELLRGLGGCTWKEAAELARLTMARDHSLTVDGIMATRRTTFLGANGLTPVDCKQPFYAAPASLVTWLKKEKAFFLNETDPRLVPRGLLFDGPPGTGKTSGAKWLAENLGVPLYRIDIGGTKSKWVGESEGRMLQNLQRIDNEAPAVVLFDEVEKVFTTDNHDSSGTTTTMLSQLLWWLAERRSRILVVMTTNKAKMLPKELYREGRIDEVMWLTGLNAENSIYFMKGLLDTFKLKGTPSASELKALLETIQPVAPGKLPTEQLYAQASLTKAVYSFVKKQRSAQ